MMKGAFFLHKYFLPILRCGNILPDYNGFWGAPNFKALKPFIVHLELGIGNWELEIKKIGN
jgi:hypothetical protein